ncbi:MAG: helix-turn-helix transcriptional regulator [Solirubrobacteraceae bacterium]
MRTSCSLVATSGTEQCTSGRTQLGHPVRAARVLAGLRQVDLARLAGVGRTTVVNIEGGKTEPRLGTAQALAQVLGCDVSSLFPSDCARPSGALDQPPCCRP